MEKSVDLGKGGSTAVTAILINCQKLIVANVGDSRAVICRNGIAKQLSVDHEPSAEKELIENRGGFVSNFPGIVFKLILPLLGIPDAILFLLSITGSGLFSKLIISISNDVMKICIG